MVKRASWFAEIPTREQSKSAENIPAQNVSPRDACWETQAENVSESNSKVVPSYELCKKNCGGILEGVLALDSGNGIVNKKIKIKKRDNCSLLFYPATSSLTKSDHPLHLMLGS